MNKSFLFTAFIVSSIALWAATPVQAESGFHVSGELGMSFDESLLLGIKGRWVSFNSFKDGDELGCVAQLPTEPLLGGQRVREVRHQG